MNTHRQKRTERIIASVSRDLAQRAREIAAGKAISLSRVIERSLLFYLEREGEYTKDQHRASDRQVMLHGANEH